MAKITKKLILGEVHSSSLEKLPHRFGRQTKPACWFYFIKVAPPATAQSFVKYLLIKVDLVQRLILSIFPCPASFSWRFFSQKLALRVTLHFLSCIFLWGSVCVFCCGHNDPIQPQPTHSPCSYGTIELLLHKQPKHRKWKLLSLPQKAPQMHLACHGRLESPGFKPDPGSF